LNRFPYFDYLQNGLDCLGRTHRGQFLGAIPNPVDLLDVPWQRFPAADSSILWLVILALLHCSRAKVNRSLISWLASSVLFWGISGIWAVSWGEAQLSHCC